MECKLRKVSLKEQNEIIETCLNENLSLTDVLKGQGYEMDSLRYRVKKKFGFPEPSSDINSIRRRKKRIPCVSLFSGAGGLDIGFHLAGADNVASLEVNEMYCDTLRVNGLSENVFQADLSKREQTESVLRQQCGLTEKFEGVFHGGPPCQPFSIASNQRFSKGGKNFKRNGFDNTELGGLADDFIWYVERFLPKALVVENVPGIINLDGGRWIRGTIMKLEKLGYSVAKPTIFNVAQFGVPQNRKRVFIVAARGVANVGLPLCEENELACGAFLNRDLSNLKNHTTREHKAASVVRYMELEYGQREKLGRVDRLDPRLPSKTVIAGGTGGGGRSHLHPEIPRTLSPRECAILQTFPDSYEFTGPPARQLTQVGNAVPPLMAYRVAKALIQSVF